MSRYSKDYRTVGIQGLIYRALMALRVKFFPEKNKHWTDMERYWDPINRGTYISLRGLYPEEIKPARFFHGLHVQLSTIVLILSLASIFQSLKMIAFFNGLTSQVTSYNAQLERGEVGPWTEAQARWATETAAALASSTTEEITSPSATATPPPATLEFAPIQQSFDPIPGKGLQIAMIERQGGNTIENANCITFLIGDQGASMVLGQSYVQNAEVLIANELGGDKATFNDGKAVLCNNNGIFDSFWIIRPLPHFSWEELMPVYTGVPPGSTVTLVYLP